MDPMTPQHSVGRDANAGAALSLMQQATDANLGCSLRRGALVELPAEGDVIIAGDIHGKMMNFRAIVDGADLYRNRTRHLVLQELVHEENLPRDVDACTSYRLVEMAARLKVTFPERVHVILGNHEFAELCDLAIAKHGRELTGLFDAGLQRAYGARWEAVKGAYKAFWRSLPLALVTPHGAFIAHSTPDARHMAPLTRDYLASLEPGQDMERMKPPFHLLWGRDYSTEATEQFAEQIGAELFIVAHTPCKAGYDTPSPRHIVIDSSCAHPRVLLLPLDRPVAQRDALAGIRRLKPDPAPTSEGAT